MEKLLQPGTQRAFRHGKVEKDFLDTDATDGLFLDCCYPELFWMPMLNPNVNLRPASMCQLIASVGYLGHFGMSWDIVYAEAQSRPWCTAALYRANGVAFGSCFRRSGRSSGAQGAAVDTVQRTREDKRGQERNVLRLMTIDN